MIFWNNFWTTMWDEIITDAMYHYAALDAQSVLDTIKL